MGDDLDKNTILLAANWDYRPELGTDPTNYVRRAKESGHVTDFIRRQSKGALLLGGKRGVGKTSLIIDAINEVSSSEQGVNLIPILIDASFMNISSLINEKKEVDNVKTKQHMLQTLIRGLYNTIKRDTAVKSSEDLEQRIEPLYKKVIAEEVSEERKRDASMSKAVSSTTEVIMQMDFKMIGRFIMSAISAIVTSIILTMNNALKDLGIWNSIIPLVILGLPIIFAKSRA